MSEVYTFVDGKRVDLKPRKILMPYETWLPLYPRAVKATRHRLRDIVDMPPYANGLFYTINW